MNYFLNIPMTYENMVFFLGQFKCQRCKDSCCMRVKDGIALKPEEVDILAPLKGLSKKQFKERYTFTRDGTRFLVGPCPFYSVDMNGCSIHSSRPQVCRQFPFNQVYEKNGVKYMTVNVDCPAGKVVGERYGIKPESVGVKV